MKKYKILLDKAILVLGVIMMLLFLYFLKDVLEFQRKIGYAKEIFFGFLIFWASIVIYNILKD